jgi:hypothetical protein
MTNPALSIQLYHPYDQAAISLIHCIMISFSLGNHTRNNAMRLQMSCCCISVSVTLTPFNQRNVYYLLLVCIALNVSYVSQVNLRLAGQRTSRSRAWHALAGVGIWCADFTGRWDRLSHGWFVCIYGRARDIHRCPSSVAVPTYLRWETYGGTYGMHVSTLGCASHVWLPLF